MSRSSSHSRNNLPPTSSPARIRIGNEGALEREHDRDGPISCSLSLLSARRPSLALSPYDNPQDIINAGLASYRDVPKLGIQSQLDESSSPEFDGGNLRKNFQIIMKDLVGDAVGNMSISPVGRDIVLAARRGLFIIDLEAPFEIPRFLPQGGTWDVADVQWNPHRLRAEYIVSTSSEKLLIWNLMMSGKTSIEHILHSHYRAITDINWHTFEPDIVSSVGIDSWLWTWDLREPRKPVLGLCAFNDPCPGGGTQVKWNRQDPNVLASSHMDHVLIWDRRKGSLPTARIRAHNAKIYGIDWAHARASDIVTCSLDKSIKVWNVNEATSTENFQPEPLTTITTHYPVWRARDLPFGRGVLSLPQRGETSLGMWAEDNPLTPAVVFEGHTDVVKEFVWRKGGADGAEYQLITWSKDRTLRFWPVSSEAMEKIGYQPRCNVEAQSQPYSDRQQSFRHPPESRENVPTLSAPIGFRSILAEVRAGPPPPRKIPNPVLQPHHGSAARGKGAFLLESGAPASHLRNQDPRRSYNQNQHPVPIPGTTMMSRGNIAGGKLAKMDPVVWLSSVKGYRREGSSSSRVSSRSRTSPQREHSVAPTGQKRKRSTSRTRDGRDSDGGPQSLQDEITSVLTKPALKSIRLEKHDLTKKRTCTVALHGPWGESSSAFVRVSFRFPKSYPHAPHPEGTPEIDLERSPLIPIQNRAFMLRKLRTIRERRRPCLEACLRFLLFGDEDDQVTTPVDMGSGSSSEDEGPGQLTRKSRNFTVSLLRNNNNVPEPRTSQGVFGPNGELVCFFRAMPRIIRNASSEVASPAAYSRSPPSSQPIVQSPSLLSDAIRRLGLAAVDRRPGFQAIRRLDESDHTLRIMTNLLTFSRQKPRRNSDTQPDISSSSVAGLPVRGTTVYVKIPSDISFSQRKVAAAYVFEAPTLGGLCATNARIAREHGQFGHERMFKTLQSLFPMQQSTATENIFTVATLYVVEKLHKEFCTNYDVQMLAMLAVVLLKAHACIPTPSVQSPSIKEPASAISKTDDDYFSLPTLSDSQAGVLSPGWPRLPAVLPASNMPPASSLTSSSSRGSWSSLFNTGSMRHFMSGVHESIATPLDTLSPRLAVVTPGGDGILRLPESPRRKEIRKDSSSSSTAPLSKSWSEPHVIPLTRPSLSQTSSHPSRRPTFSQAMNTKQAIQQKRLVIIDEDHDGMESDVQLKPFQLERFACHILSYADYLFRWQLMNKRLELLNAVKASAFMKTPPQSQLNFGFGIQPACKRCGRTQTTDMETCSHCGIRPGKPSCSICRLPVKGLSISCGQCLHISHVKCWRNTQSEVCGSGCGCTCSGRYKPSEGPALSALIA